MSLRKYQVEKQNDRLDQELSLHLTHHQMKHITRQSGEDPAFQTREEAMMVQDHLVRGLA